MWLFPTPNPAIIQQNQQDPWISVSNQCAQDQLQVISPQTGFQASSSYNQPINPTSIRTQTWDQTQEQIYRGCSDNSKLNHNPHHLHHLQSLAPLLNTNQPFMATQPVCQNPFICQFSQEVPLHRQGQSQLMQVLQQNNKQSTNSDHGALSPKAFDAIEILNHSQPKRNWDREMSEEEKNWAFESIHDLNYLDNPDLKDLIFSLP